MVHEEDLETMAYKDRIYQHQGHIPGRTAFKEHSISVSVCIVRHPSKRMSPS